MADPTQTTNIRATIAALAVVAACASAFVLGHHQANEETLAELHGVVASMKQDPRAQMSALTLETWADHLQDLYDRR